MAACMQDPGFADTNFDPGLRPQAQSQSQLDELEARSTKHEARGPRVNAYTHSYMHARCQVPGASQMGMPAVVTSTMTL